ncbi:hypothetical protein [Candidatus Vallotiella sp. (ex Adelges kitamiensis)]|uniref:hypothetical protein n=1 Tax=Candidatus Vallotiella sp. (ex Adelges kitamiensis) TaxID=2864217 RepID=UPI001CE2FE59|nr:hypothetical protein [Candidatus Vallotia sp. (ex Adelges kitamiensis)]
MVLNALDAKIRGASILTRTGLMNAQRCSTWWNAKLRLYNGRLKQIRACAIVNATGP